MGIFDNDMFDLNGDGVVDGFERAFAYEIIFEDEDEEERDSDCDD